MELVYVPRDFWLLLGAALAGIVVGAFHSRLGTETSPVWPVRLYLLLFRHNQPRVVRQYAERRTTFRWREQFMASAFVWFFIFFVVAVFVFGCSRRANAC